MDEKFNLIKGILKMKKKLFKKASIEEMKHIATVGGYNNTRYMYVNV
jgi:hypothetical protein